MYLIKISGIHKKPKGRKNVRVEAGAGAAEPLFGFTPLRSRSRKKYIYGPVPTTLQNCKGLRKYILLGRKFAIGNFKSSLKFYSFLPLSSISEIIIPPYHKVYFIRIQFLLTKKISRTGSGSS
jgi:hypothetical protein